jgi:hypothetical protein
VAGEAVQRAIDGNGSCGLYRASVQEGAVVVVWLAYLVWLPMQPRSILMASLSSYWPFSTNRLAGQLCASAMKCDDQRRGVVYGLVVPRV